MTWARIPDMATYNQNGDYGFKFQIHGSLGLHNLYHQESNFWIQNCMKILNFSASLDISPVWITITSITEADELNFYFKIDISTIDAASGTPRVQNCQEETTQFKFLGFWCNHVVLKLLHDKFLSKRAKKSYIFEVFGL